MVVVVVEVNGWLPNAYREGARPWSRSRAIGRRRTTDEG